jgi:uncharacterized secreted protein with C-terminal beta-propeller domain
MVTYKPSVGTAVVLTAGTNPGYVNTNVVVGGVVDQVLLVKTEPQILAVVQVEQVEKVEEAELVALALLLLVTNQQYKEHLAATQ